MPSIEGMEQVKTQFGWYDRSFQTYFTQKTWYLTTGSRLNRRDEKKAGHNGPAELIREA